MQEIEDIKINRRRYFRITGFFARVILSIVFWDLLVSRLWMIGPRVKRNRPNRYRSIARRFRFLAVDMGGVMIKLGQFLSARVDVLPIEIITELAGLQDEVPAVDIKLITAVIERELGDPDELFLEMEMEPLAAASLGQTHRAWLKSAETPDGRDAVVIKVQRPDIEEVVLTDLSALAVVARWVMRYRPIRQRANVPALMDEFGVTLYEELDYRLEYDNALKFADMFADYEGLHVPSFYSQFCTGRILVMENVEGLKVTDLDRIAELGIDPKQIADRLLDLYFVQVFENAWFHADPHPGNIFLRATPGPIDPDTPTPFDIIFIDFGMMGRIPEKTSNLLKQVIISVTTRNANGLTKAYDDLGFFLPGADLERITEAQEKVLDQIWGRDLLDLSKPDMDEVQELGSEFTDLLFDFPFQIPQNFIYLGRALGILSGLSAMLNPSINPWYYIEQYGQRIISSQDVGRAGVDAVVDTVRQYAAIPAQIKRLLGEAEQGRLKLQFKPDRKTEQQLERIERRSRQLNSTLVSASGLLAGTILYVSDEPTIGITFWGISALIYLWSAWRG